MTTITYSKEKDLKLDLYLPEREKPDLFIYMHGGGIESGSRGDFRAAAEKLLENGIASASLDYRLYPKAVFPEFIEDCAEGIDYLLNKSGHKFGKITVGGSSAGSYLSMMLLFDKHYLGKYGINPLSLDGWFLDAGQPTTHFNVLRERGLDSRLVRIDEAAPLYFIDGDFSPVREDGKLPMVMNIAASCDMTCRLEQLRLLDATLKHFNYPSKRLRFEFMNGYSHCQYDWQPIFAKMIIDFIASC